MHEAASKALFMEDVSGLTDRLVTIRNWKIYNVDFPVLDVGFRAESRPELRLRLVTKNWNDDPPSIELLNAEGLHLPRQDHPVPQGPPSIFHAGNHPSTGRPFVCMAGALEYHTHSSHVTDLWSGYKTRSGYNLGGIVTQIWNGWLKSKP